MYIGLVIEILLIGGNKIYTQIHAIFRKSSGIQDVFLQNIHLYIAGFTPGQLLYNFKIIYL